MYRVYYGNGSTCESGDDLPGRGVQAILQDHPQVGIEIVTGGDFYVSDRGRWRAVDRFGLYDYLLELVPKLVLFGRMASREEYESIVSQAIADGKAGWAADERQQWRNQTG